MRALQLKIFYLKIHVVWYNVNKSLENVALMYFQCLALRFHIADRKLVQYHYHRCKGNEMNDLVSAMALVNLETLMWRSAVYGYGCKGLCLYKHKKTSISQYVQRSSPKSAGLNKRFPTND